MLAFGLYHRSRQANNCCRWLRLPKARHLSGYIEVRAPSEHGESRKSYVLQLLVSGCTRSFRRVFVEAAASGDAPIANLLADLVALLLGLFRVSS